MKMVLYMKVITDKGIKLQNIGGINITMFSVTQVHYAQC